MSHPCKWLVWLNLCFGILLLSPCAAQGKDKENLFRSGVEYFNSGDYAAAAESFRAAYEILPSWKILYNIGQSEAAARQHDLALESFEAYLAQGGDDIGVERREEVLAEVDRLRQMVGSIEVLAPAGAIIYVDDVERGTAPLLGKLTVTAGIAHQIRAVRDGANVAEKEFKVRGKDSLSIDLRIKPDKNSNAENPGGPLISEQIFVNPIANDSPNVDKPQSSTSKRSPLLLSGIVTTGVGAGALIAAIVAGVITKNLDDQLTSECPEGVCESDLRDKRDQMNTMRKTTNVLLISGGVVTGTGLALVVAGLVKNKKRTAQATLSPNLSPIVSPLFTGLFLRGSF